MISIFNVDSISRIAKLGRQLESISFEYRSGTRNLGDQLRTSELKSATPSVLSEMEPFSWWISWKRLLHSPVKANNSSDFNFKDCNSSPWSFKLKSSLKMHFDWRADPSYAWELAAIFCKAVVFTRSTFSTSLCFSDCKSDIMMLRRAISSFCKI